MFISFSTIFAIIVIFIFVSIGYLEKNGTFLRKELKPYYERSLQILKPYLSCSFAKCIKISILNNLKTDASIYKDFVKENRKPKNEHDNVQYLYDLINSSSNYSIVESWCYLFIEYCMPSGHNNDEKEIYKSFKDLIKNNSIERINKTNLPKSFLYKFNKIKTT